MGKCAKTTKALGLLAEGGGGVHENSRELLQREQSIASVEHICALHFVFLQLPWQLIFHVHALSAHLVHR